MYEIQHFFFKNSKFLAFSTNLAFHENSVARSSGKRIGTATFFSSASALRQTGSGQDESKTSDEMGEREQDLKVHCQNHNPRKLKTVTLFSVNVQING